MVARRGKGGREDRKREGRGVGLGERNGERRRVWGE